MGHCEWREKPGLAPKCPMAVSDGATMCPRHVFLDSLQHEQRLERERKLLIDRKIVKRMPSTRGELLEQGYQSVGNGVCSGCKTPIQWWRTPNGNNAPYNPMDGTDSRAVSHFATCPARQQFRRSA